MGADRSRKPLRLDDERGQSILEFCLMLPLLVALTVMLVKVNTAIQISIVNQQYARAQTLFVTFNSPYYPFLRLREENLTNQKFNAMVLGVADAPIPETGSKEPEATVQTIAPRKTSGGSDERGEVQLRNRVRIRNSVLLCSQPNVLRGGQKILELGGESEGFPAKGSYALNEGSQFDLCRSPE